MNDFKQQAQHITPKTNKKRPYGDYGDGKRLKMKFEELHNDKETNDEYLLNTVKESLNKGELCLFMGETGTFMTTGTTDDAEEIFLKLQSVLLAGFLSMEKATDYDIEQILLLELEALKEVREELSDVHPIEHGQQRKVFILNSNRGYFKEPQIEILTVNKVGILYIYTDYDKYRKSNGKAVESSLDIKAFATLEEAETGLFMIKARQYYRNSIKVDDITYAQMKAIFDILGIDTEEVLK